MEVFIIALVMLIVMFLYSAIKIMREYERAVVFFLGRFQGVVSSDSEVVAVSDTHDSDSISRGFLDRAPHGTDCGNVSESLCGKGVSSCFVSNRNLLG